LRAAHSPLRPRRKSAARWSASSSLSPRAARARCSRVQLRAAGLSQLETLLERFPRARIILDHMARPVVDDGPPYTAAASLFALARYKNLFLKLTTHNVRDTGQGKATPHSFFGRIVDAFGASRVAFKCRQPAAL
jgi:predicted TIM-barrel fold metal-dependent hydrolase